MGMTENEFADLCEAAIENTARLLGVDPVALAEACRDGKHLLFALRFTARQLKSKGAHWLSRDEEAWIKAKDGIAALKPATYGPTTSNDGPLMDETES